MSEKDKERYKKDVENYKLSTEKAEDEPPKKKRKVKNKKDPNAPKRAVNAYILFSKAIRPLVLKENPDLKARPVEILRIVGKKWKDLSPEEKMRFKEEALKDKNRYEEQLKSYKDGGGSAAASPITHKNTKPPSEVESDRMSESGSESETEIKVEEKVSSNSESEDLGDEVILQEARTIRLSNI
eukprot:TRINITY_DN10274_c0_g1_i1.p1 TRINITY_DN10274_c0_g1~~TRINITY_DN10274_c0_g1_i1.p1  ORF type:complete len:184 (+),score=35.44 TRINITY_DN10274_c0_g1_i1:402-953(+)